MQVHKKMQIVQFSYIYWFFPSTSNLWELRSEGRKRAFQMIWTSNLASKFEIVNVGESAYILIYTIFSL